MINSEAGLAKTSFVSVLSQRISTCAETLALQIGYLIFTQAIVA